MGYFEEYCRHNRIVAGILHDQSIDQTGPLRVAQQGPKRRVASHVNTLVTAQLPGSRPEALHSPPAGGIVGSRGRGLYVDVLSDKAVGVVINLAEKCIANREVSVKRHSLIKVYAIRRC